MPAKIRPDLAARHHAQAHREARNALRRGERAGQLAQAIAATVSKRRTPSTDADAKERRSTSIPIRTKKTGTRSAIRGSRLSCSGGSPRWTWPFEVDLLQDQAGREGPDDRRQARAKRQVRQDEAEAERERQHDAAVRSASAARKRRGERNDPTKRAPTRKRNALRTISTIAPADQRLPGRRRLDDPGHDRENQQPQHVVDHGRAEDDAREAGAQRVARPSAHAP